MDKLADRVMLHFSDGILPFPFHFKTELSGNDTIQLSWENDSQLNGRHNTDELLMVTALGSEFLGPYQTGVCRSALVSDIAIPAEAGSADAVFFFFASSDRKRFSPDKYFELKKNN